MNFLCNLLNAEFIVEIFFFISIEMVLIRGKIRVIMKRFRPSAFESDNEEEFCPFIVPKKEPEDDFESCENYQPTTITLDNDFSDFCREIQRGGDESDKESQDPFYELYKDESLPCVEIIELKLPDNEDENISSTDKEPLTTFKSEEDSKECIRKQKVAKYLEKKHQKTGRKEKTEASESSL